MSSLKTQKSNDTLSYVSGNSIIQDIYGNTCFLSEITSNESFYTFSFDEKSRRLIKNSISGVQNCSQQMDMIKISTVVGSIEVSRNHKVMVNKNGRLEWVDSQDVQKGDLVMSPKHFRREMKETDWKSAISIEYERIKASKTVNVLVSKTDTEQSLVKMSSGFNKALLFYIVGLIDGGGWLDQLNGYMSVRVDNWPVAYILASSLAEMFCIEPSIEGNKNSGFRISAENKIAVDILSFARRELFSQEDEYITHYLSGVTDMCGNIFTSNKRAKIVYEASNEFGIQDRIIKAMYVFGIIGLKKTKNSVTIDTFSSLETVASILDLKLEFLTDALVTVVRNNFGKEDNSIGYHFGKALEQDRKLSGLKRNKLGFSAQTIAAYEKGSFVPYSRACEIAEVITKFLPKAISIKETNVVDLVCCDLVGSVVTKVQDIGQQKAYSLSSKHNNNMFLNNILVSTPTS